MSAPKTRQELIEENAELREKLAAVRDHVEQLLDADLAGEEEDPGQD